MSVTYRSSLKTTRMNSVLSDIDNSTNAATLEIGTTAMGTVLATITLGKPSGSVSGSVLTFTMPKSDTDADNTGTAAAARIKDGDGNIIVSGLTAGTSGTDIILNSTSITQHTTVTINSGTITHG